jgi:hypothetical protein
MINENDLPADARWLLKWARLAADCLLEFGKPVGLLSVPVAIWFIARYTSEVHIPFPIGSSTLPTLFVVVVVTVCYVLSIIALSMGWIIVLQTYPFRSDRLRREAPHLRSHVKPLYGLRFKIRRAEVDVERRRRKRRRRFSAMASQEYLLIHAPFLSVWFLGVGMIIFNSQPSGMISFLLLIASFITGGAIATAFFYSFRSKTSDAGRAESDLTRTGKFALAAAEECAITIVSLLPYLGILYAMASAETRIFGVFLFVIILIAHYFANISRFRPAQTTLVCLLILFMPIIMITSGTPLLVGAALRMLGIGGGIPREVTLLTTDPVSGKPAVRVIDGCLLLLTSDAISLHQVPNESGKNSMQTACVLPRMLHDISDASDRWSVETYPASSVVRVTTIVGGSK